MMMDRASAVIAAAVAIAYLCSYFKMHGGKQTIMHAAIWLVCIGMSTMLYTKQSAIVNNEIVASVIPGRSYHTPQKAVYYKANDGHFYIDALIGNVTIRFIVDTGATGMAITPNDAKKLGIDIQGLNFTEEYETASGTTRAAPAVIPSMLIGEFMLKNVPVSINESDSSISLMGMSVLKQFSIQIHQDQLVLSR